jgi:1-acyl-sn-glycerol-3-phosphate acyltransferase
MADLSLQGFAPRHPQASAWFHALKTRLFEFTILVWSLPFGLLILTVFQIARPPWLVRRALRLWSRGFIFAARWIVGVRYEVEGWDFVPDHPVIFVCNHQSYWESIALTALIPDINVVAKVEAMKIPVFGWGLRHAPMIPVHRGKRGHNLRRMSSEAKKSVAAGRSILIFPEGTRVKPGRLRTYQRGLELLYEACETEIVPVAHNAGLCWTEGFRTKSPGLVRLCFYPPIRAGQDPSLVASRTEAFINREKERLAEAVGR